jgi:hypothetical protein
MAISPNTDFVSGAILTAAQQNLFPRGVVGAVLNTTGLAGVSGGPVDLAGMTVTFNQVINRIYRATWTVNGSKAATSADSTRVIFANAANTQLGGINLTSSGTNDLNLSASVIFTASASGSVTYKLRAASFSGTFTPQASVAYPCVFVIEDIGAA